MKNRRPQKSEILNLGGGRKRRCSLCNRRYHRRNLEELWYNTGRVWLKKIQRVCVECSLTCGVKDAKISAPAWTR